MQKVPLRIIADADSLASNASKRLIAYPDNEIFEIIGFGDINGHVKTKITPPGNDGVPGSIIINESRELSFGYWEEHYLGYLDETLRTCSRELHIDYQDIVKIFSFASLSNKPTLNNQKYIFVTENRSLLDNFQKINESFLNFEQFSIFSAEEANLFVDIFCKKRGAFFVAPHLTVNAGLWYLHQMRSRANDFNLPWSIVVNGMEIIPNHEKFMQVLDSLGTRLIDMFIAIDEIGKQYYQGANNDSLNMTIYHFNYWVTLFTGVLDTLAFVALHRYCITYTKQIKVGLRAKTNKEYLKTTSYCNIRLFQFIKENQKIINLMYGDGPRDLIIHRERMRGVQVIRNTKEFKINMLFIGERFFNKIVNISGYKGNVSNPWGHTQQAGMFFLEPYGFAKNATNELLTFVNSFLDNLSFEDYLKKNEILNDAVIRLNVEKNGYFKERDLFVKSHLGY